MRGKLTILGACAAALLIAFATYFRSNLPNEGKGIAGKTRDELPHSKPESTPAATPPDIVARTEGPISSQAANKPLEVRKHFKDLIDLHRSASVRFRSVHIGDGNGDNLTWRMQYGYIQARLLAICYPKECEDLISGLLLDSHSTCEDLLFAARMLGTLAAQGSKVAESQLVKLSQNSDPLVVSRAIRELFGIDKVGQYRALYWTRISEGKRLIYDLGPYWVDVQTKQVLQSIKEAYDAKNSRDDRNLEALARMAILESSLRSVTLDHILNGIPDQGDYSQMVHERLPWALRVVQANPSDQSVDILRKRLERDEVAAASLLFDRIMEPPGPASPGFVHATGDEYYDEVLLAYQAMGGKLNTNQVQRLTYFGYLGDSHKRLIELLGEQK